jgi:YVTN family beta-propeller protein
VTVIDGATNSVIATVTVGAWPGALCYNPQNNKVYCANYDTASVTVIDGATNSVLATVAVGYHPLVLRYNPANNKIYCANSGSANVTVIDGTSDTVVTTIGVGAYPADIIWRPAQNRVYVADYEGSSISVIRDAVGIEEDPNGEFRMPHAEATVFSGTVALKLDAASFAYDATGRRVTKPGVGVYFVREHGRVRKVVIAR